MYTKTDLQKVKKAIESSDNVAILSHKNPDPDALGSATALYEVLTGLGKDVRMFVPSVFPDGFSFIPSAEKVEVLEGNTLPVGASFDLAIFVDGGELHRFVDEGEFEIPKNVAVVKIDHHHAESEITDLSLHDVDASSAAEVIYDLLKFAEWKITKGAAKSLLIGIIGDTGWFKYVGTSPDTFRKSAELLEINNCLAELDYCFMHRAKTSFIPLWETMMKNIEVDVSRSFIYTKVDYDEIRSAGVDEKDFSMAYHLFGDGIMRMFSNIDTSLILLEKDKDVLRGSMRSEIGLVEVNKICADFEEGGGHPRAAGFTTRKKYDEVMKIVHKGLKKYKVK